MALASGERIKEVGFHGVRDVNPRDVFHRRSRSKVPLPEVYETPVREALEQLDQTGKTNHSIWMAQKLQ